MRTTFLGTLIGPRASSPVVLAQVGAAALSRQDDGALRLHRRRVRKLLLLDRTSLTDRIWERLEEESDPAGIEVMNSGETTAYTDSTAFGGVSEPRSRAAHVANWHMRLTELDLLREVLPARAPGSWVALDGSLGKEFRDRSVPDGYLGVIKNFSKEVAFEVPGPRGARRVNLHDLLARLPVAHRTAVFGREDGRVALWYVRLRGPLELDYPLMGVIKVEVPLEAGEWVQSAVADRLSRCLVAERTVAPHGRDARWHAHLYPIHMAERAVRAGFVSHEVLRAGVRWPRHRGAA